MQPPIIDAHCHAGPGDGFTGPWDTEAGLEQYLRRCAEAGIGGSNLFAAFHSDYAVANEAVGRIVAGRPDRFTGFAFVHAERDRGRVLPMVRRAVGEWGFRGIKVHRHDARLSREICEVARRLRLPILYDVAGETTAVALVASAFPDVDFVIPHLGSFADDWAAQAAFCPVLAQHANVYTDTSGVRRFDLLERAVCEAGPHKVLFGSDGPWLHPGAELAKVRLLHLPPAAEALVLGGNFRRLTRRSPAPVPGTPPSRSPVAARR
jgi:predicted TIM-barrel fold metal-dependent hydrolase